MQRQRGGLVPIGEVVSGLDGPVKETREASPQARRVFTQAGQVNQACLGPRSGRRSRFHGADDGAVLPARTNPGKGYLNR